MTAAAFDRFHPEQATEAFDVQQSVSYNWEYENTRRRLVRLYENAKRDQWNATERLDWSIDVDPEAGLVPDMSIGIYGTPMWDKLTEAEVRKLPRLALYQLTSAEVRSSSFLATVEATVWIGCVITVPT